MNRGLTLICGLCLILLLSGTALAWEGKYDRYFQRYGQVFFPLHPWQWFKAQGMAESSLRPWAISPAGAMGIMQIMPATAKSIGLIDPFNPEMSILAGIKYDRWLWRFWGKRVDPEYPEDLCFAFASYNAGVGRVWRTYKAHSAERRGHSAESKECKRLLRKLPRETCRYVARIDGYFQALIYD